ncbi:MAG: GIY-YIG nuclease family protein [SAR324 cluster bacterium]|nr:GIY-YIG nuclease family protein [SAR324 cluster bacterium]
MITLHRIFEIYGLNPEDIKSARHGNKELPVLQTFQNDIAKWEAYQSFQSKPRFSNAKHVAAFAPAKGSSSLFLALWDIVHEVTSDKFTKEQHSLIDKYGFPEKWHSQSTWYDLRRNPKLDDLSERLIIEWGKSTLSWVQKKDKDVLEIKGIKGKNSIGNFVSYDQVQLSYCELKKLTTEASDNSTWETVLSVVNGVYLISDLSCGKQYVGSAYGENGIFGRWADYAHNGHGGNKELKNLDPNNFEFSILEIAPATLSAEEVIQRENRWKERLKTREFGLNSN